MTTFTVWKFETPDGAKRAMTTLREAESDGLVTVVDHAIVSWPPGRSTPKSRHTRDAAAKRTAWGALWGVVAGALFFIPVAGAVAGAAIGALSKSLEGTGITKKDLETIRGEVTEGTSALFLVTEAGDLDELGDRLRGMNKTLVSTNLTDAERAVLVETFGG
jgi:uncharacterized membrane protein